MIKNYIKIAIRNIWANKTFSFINIVGLSVSMSLGLLIILIVKEQYSLDRFHKDADRIYRVETRALRVGSGSEDYATVPTPLATVLKENYSFTEDIVRLNRRLNQDMIFGNVRVPVSGLFADPSFLKIFAGKTHLEFEALASMTALPVLEKQGIMSPSLESWTDYYSGLAYIKLQQGKKEKDVNAALATISKKYYAGMKLE